MKGCEHCLEKKEIIDESCQRMDQTGIRINRLDVFIIGNELWAEGDMGFMFMQGKKTIKFCPVCGRELKKEKAE